MGDILETSSYGIFVDYANSSELDTFSSSAESDSSEFESNVSSTSSEAVSSEPEIPVTSDLLEPVTSEIAVNSQIEVAILRIDGNLNFIVTGIFPILVAIFIICMGFRWFYRTFIQV